MKKKALIGLLALSMTLTTACGSKGSDDSKKGFYYSGYISLIAASQDGTFTADEEQEVLAILGSFRVGE